MDNYSYKPCILTPEQFAFMQARHEEVVHGQMAAKFGDDSWIDTFIESEEYKRIFGDMLWDDVIDRYEDTPGYDNTLWLALHQKLKEDVEAGRVIEVLEGRRSHFQVV